MTSHFIVVGGGFTGLSAAYALSRSGHQVTVLEKDNFDFVSPLMVGFDSTFGVCIERVVFKESDGEVCRMAPNMSKIFFRWGLEERLRRIAVRSNVTIFSRCKPYFVCCFPLVQLNQLLSCTRRRTRGNPWTTYMGRRISQRDGRGLHICSRTSSVANLTPRSWFNHVA